MLLFIEESRCTDDSGRTFQYILYYSLSISRLTVPLSACVSKHLMLPFIKYIIQPTMVIRSFNTSHITLYQQG